MMGRERFSKKGDVSAMQPAHSKNVIFQTNINNKLLHLSLQKSENIPYAVFSLKYCPV